MTIIEAINKIDAVNPNSYEQSDKVGWLSVLDGIIKNEIIDTHEGADEVAFEKYTDDTPLDTVLLVPDPYDEVYIYFLESRIHYENEEFGKYNNAVSMYNTAFNKYMTHYNRTHMPKGVKFKFF